MIFSRLVSMLMGRTLWVLLGLLALCYLIWVAGAAIAINQWYPLERASVRLGLIIAILGLYLLRIIWRKWREGRLNAQLLKHLRKPAKKNKASATQEDNAEVQLLNQRFDEAVGLLKNARFAHKQGEPAWLSKLSRQYVYQLPWYMFIGAPGSGKTTALVNAGLTFPLADTFGKTALKGVGGTRNCDWWFTDEAVLLDTAGRYTTHESDPISDEQEWQGFLGLLSRYRGRQPINGVILTVSLSDLLSANDTDRAQHAAVLRKRLNELQKQLGIHFPVYVLVTKMDLLSGFEAYFSQLDRTQLEQVWGFSFSYEQSQQTDFDFLRQYRSEFQLLHQRLEAGLADELGKLSDPAERAQAFLLPQQFAALQETLGYFLSDVFASSRFDAYPPPRGVYFSSGTQGGMAFDPASAQLGSELQLASTLKEKPKEEEGKGKSYFLYQLLNGVVFKEAGLAGLNMKWERRYRRMQWLAYGACALILLLMISWWWISYQNNKQYVQHVEQRVPLVNEIADATVIDEAAEVLGLMPFLSANWDLTAGDNFYPPQSPWSYTAGLYQGNKLQAASQSVYTSVLEKQLLPQVARLLEQSVEHAPPHDLEQRYEALRAYLMLYDAERYDAVFLKEWVLRQLQPVLPADYTRGQYERLTMHLENLLTAQVWHSPFAKNEKLVSTVRSELDQYGLAERAYSRVLRLYGASGDQDSSLISLAGAEATLVFERDSMRPFNEGVPALFSYNGYWNVFSKRVDAVVEQLYSDDEWILAIGQKQPPRTTVITDVRRLYFTDYVKRWDQFLADVRLRRPESLIDAIELARSVSASNSPLGRFIKNVAFETTLLREDEQNQRSILDRARERVSSSTQSLEQMFGPVGMEGAIRHDSTPERLEEMVDRHFVKYHELATAVNASTPPPIEGTIALLNELYTYLTAADSALRSQSPLPQPDVLSKLQGEAGRMPGAVGDMLNQLVVESGAAVNSVRQQQVGEGVNATLGNYCRRSIAGRYPFAQSTADVAPNDFARFFGPQQMMEQFFNTELASLVDRSGTRMRFKPGIDGRQAEATRYLRSFEQAARIRDVFFAAGSMEPSFKVAIRVIDMDTDITRLNLDVDGQVLHYAHGPQVASTVQWPGERGSNQVVLGISPQQGRSGLSATGPWALHRLLDMAADVRQGSSPEITIARFDLDGRHFSLELRAYSSSSPFNLAELKAFACPGRG